MSNRMVELSKLRKTIDPLVLQTILLDEMCGRLEELGEKMDKLGAFVTFMGPMTRLFKRDLQYQYATVPAGESGQIYLYDNPQPELLVGIITQVANDWYPDTYLEWFTDYLPKKMEYSIADVTEPKHYERGLPFYKEIKWLAYNDSDEDHSFGVLCDGFFIDRKIYELITSIV